MGIQSRNLFKCVSNLRYVSNTFSFYIPKRHHIFKTAGGEENRCKNDRVLVRRFRCTGLDESRYFSDLSIKNINPISQLTSRISEDLASSDNPHFCGTFTPYFSALSFENDGSPPIQNLNLPSFPGYYVVGSCGGVVCLDNFREGAIFWNPSTNESKLLPPSELDRPDPIELEDRYFFTRTFTSGFGFDPKSQDYKYIRWPTFYLRKEDDCDYADYYTIVELYSLKSDSWKRIWSPGGRGFRDSTACVNGDFYWQAAWCRAAEIIKFDFAAEDFSFMDPPHTGKSVGLSSDFVYTYKLFEYRGSLGLVVYPREMGLDEHEKSFELWVWNGGWWMKEFDDCVVEGADKPLGFSKTGRLLFLVGMQRQLLVYDIQTKELKQAGIYCNPYYPFDLIPYVESVVQLNGGTENQEDLHA